MKKFVTLILSTSLLASCSMGGFKPPKAYYIWYPGKQFYSVTREKKFNFFEQRESDMRACGMDPVRGESGYLAVNLCLEKKGWYLEQGPVCEERYVWNEPECIKWRAKYSKPDAKPWG
ncbi:hypothetical protein [Actinobacillus porcinus]|uniref:hypothetical protein n=1 Tax=Actinobacillus porcinus TaxID=51048 RepID=UPI002A917AAD|nr:hypothetical protein [Actinobacillus porcinus]MDY6215556.1 hypothetical protein [Actinobacillus porcinus]